LNNPIFCPHCNTIQAKRGFLVLEFKKEQYFIAQCWSCKEKYIIDKKWRTAKIF